MLSFSFPACFAGLLSPSCLVCGFSSRGTCGAAGVFSGAAGTGADTAGASGCGTDAGAGVLCSCTAAVGASAGAAGISTSAACSRSFFSSRRRITSASSCCASRRRCRAFSSFCAAPSTAPFRCVRIVLLNSKILNLLNLPPPSDCIPLPKAAASSAQTAFPSHR